MSCSQIYLNIITISYHHHHHHCEDGMGSLLALCGKHKSFAVRRRCIGVTGLHRTTTNTNTLSLSSADTFGSASVCCFCYYTYVSVRIECFVFYEWIPEDYNYKLMFCTWPHIAYTYFIVCVHRFTKNQYINDESLRKIDGQFTLHAN